MTSPVSIAVRNLSKFPFNVLSMLNGSQEYCETIWWESSGDGSFDDNGILNTIYTPAEADVSFHKPANKLNYLTPWNEAPNTPGSHVVAFTETAIELLEVDDIIGAFTTEDFCAGTFMFDVALPALVINGDEPYTEDLDGFTSGEYLAYSLYRPSTGETFELEVVYDPGFDQSDLFAVNGLSAITSLQLRPLTVGGLSTGNIRIYPNPSSGIVNISGFAQPAEVSIYNTLGELIYNESNFLKSQIDLTNFPDGIYIIEIITPISGYTSNIMLRPLIR